MATMDQPTRCRCLAPMGRSPSARTRATAGRRGTGRVDHCSSDGTLRPIDPAARTTAAPASSVFHGSRRVRAMTARTASVAAANVRLHTTQMPMAVAADAPEASAIGRLHEARAQQASSSPTTVRSRPVQVMTRAAAERATVTAAALRASAGAKARAATPASTPKATNTPNDVVARSRSSRLAREPRWPRRTAKPSCARKPPVAARPNRIAGTDGRATSQAVSSGNRSWP